MRLIDTHVHLDGDVFADDLDRVLAASRERGINRWINVGFNEERWRTTLALGERVPGVSFMLGLHPGDADDWSAGLFDRLGRVVEQYGPVAIGEIGIDLYWRQDNLDTQVEAFYAQLDLAIDAGLPAVIHMRAADDAMLESLDRRSSLPHIHFHSFDGNEALRMWVMSHGATIGVGGLITRKGSESLRGWVAGVPRDRVVLETDAPYLKPRGIRGRRNEPAYMVKVAELLATLWNDSVEGVARRTTENAEALFNLGKDVGA